MRIERVSKCPGNPPASTKPTHTKSSAQKLIWRWRIFARAVPVLVLSVEVFTWQMVAGRELYSQKFPPSVLGLSGSPSWLLPASTPMRLILAAWQLIRWPSLGDRRWQHTLYLSEIITNVSWWLLRIVCKRQFKPKECNCRTRTRSSVDDAGCSALQGVRPSCPLMRIPLAPCRPLSHCQLGSKPTRSETAAKTAYKGGNCEMWKCCKIQDQWIDETRSRQTLQPYGLRKQRRFTWNFLNQLCLKRVMKNEYVIAEKYDILSVTKRDR